MIFHHQHDSFPPTTWSFPTIMILSQKHGPFLPVQNDDWGIPLFCPSTKLRQLITIKINIVVWFVIDYDKTVLNYMLNVFLAVIVQCLMLECVVFSKFTTNPTKSFGNAPQSIPDQSQKFRCCFIPIFVRLRINQSETIFPTFATITIGFVLKFL